MAQGRKVAAGVARLPQEGNTESVVSAPRLGSC